MTKIKFAFRIFTLSMLIGVLAFNCGNNEKGKTEVTKSSGLEKYLFNKEEMKYAKLVDVNSWRSLARLETNPFIASERELAIKRQKAECEGLIAFVAAGYHFTIETNHDIPCVLQIWKFETKQNAWDMIIKNDFESAPDYKLYFFVDNTVVVNIESDYLSNVVDVSFINCLLNYCNRLKPELITDEKDLTLERFMQWLKIQKDSAERNR